jgi:predicted negative regulator of RcsB-dependent stress response
MKSSDYLYARVAKTPAEIVDAEKKAKAGKYDEALAAFAKLANSKYKHLGYDLDCLYWQAFCLDKLNKKDEAVNLLKKVEGYQLHDKAKTGIFFNCKKLLANIYIDQNKFDNAYPVLTELGESDDPNLAAYSFNARGEILKKQGKKKDAILLYMRTALIFPPKNSERPESLINIATLLKEMNDARAAKFEEILKKDYPDRAKDLK